MLKGVQGNYQDKYYEKVVLNNETKPYCLGYYYFNTSPNTIEAIEKSTSRVLVKVNNNLYYYRTPLLKE